jgi:hypothetical protein
MYTRESPRSHIARAYIPDLAARTTAAYKLPNFLRELVQKIEKGRQNRQDGMKGRRGKALVRSNIRQIWSRVKFLLRHERAGQHTISTSDRLLAIRLKVN